MTDIFCTECILRKGKRTGNHVDSGVSGDCAPRGGARLLGCRETLPVLRMGMVAAAAWSVFYRFSTLFAMEPWLRGLNPSLYYTVNRLVQFWM